MYELIISCNEYLILTKVITYIVLLEMPQIKLLSNQDYIIQLVFTVVVNILPYHTYELIAYK